MANFNKFNQFVEDLAKGVHQLQTGTSHVLKVMLVNSPAPVAGNSVKGDLTEIAAGNGYSAGGASIGTITGAQTGGTFKLAGDTDPEWTAAGGTIGPFRYAVLYNDTPSSPTDPLIGWWDYGSGVTLQIGEAFKVDLNQTDGIFTIA